MGIHHSMNNISIYFGNALYSNRYIFIHICLHCIDQCVMQSYICIQTASVNVHACPCCRVILLQQRPPHRIPSTAQLVIRGDGPYQTTGQTTRLQPLLG